MELVDVELDPLTMDAWKALGFEVSQTSARPFPYISLNGISLSFSPSSKGKNCITAWTFSSKTEKDTEIAGIPTKLRPWTFVESATHKNGITSMDHIVVQCPSMTPLLEAFKRLEMVPKRTGEIPGGVRPGRTFAFFKAGRTIIECVSPLPARPDGAANLWGMTLNSTDLQSTWKLWQGLNKYEIRKAVQKGRFIFTVDHVKAGLGQVEMAIMTPSSRSSL